MTVEELVNYFNKNYGDKFLQYPDSLEIDVETYGHVCFKLISTLENSLDGNVLLYTGPQGGIMFKGVELILRYENDRHSN